MSYRLEMDEDVADGIKRIATEQIDKARRQLEEQPDGLHEAIHDARKRLKKVRAALRLVRDEVGEACYAAENARLRDAGRVLSPVRDAQVFVEAIEELKSCFDDPLTRNAFATTLEHLTRRREDVLERVVEEEGGLERVLASVHEAREAIAGWPIEAGGFEALRDGLARVYRRGVAGMKGAREEPTADNLHEWRKRVKYLWYHSRILEDLWPDMMDTLSDEIHVLAGFLGGDHDLAELLRTLEEADDDDLFDSDASRRGLLALIEGRRRELQSRAWPLGARIYAEEPAVFLERVERYWEVAYEG